MPQNEWSVAAPTECDFTKHDILEGKHPITEEFIDGRTKGGPWANMCPECFASFGVGLGTGRGQRYRKQADGRWIKVEG